MLNAKMSFVRPGRQEHVQEVLCIGFLKKLKGVSLHWLSGAAIPLATQNLSYR